MPTTSPHFAPNDDDAAWVMSIAVPTVDRIARRDARGDERVTEDLQAEYLARLTPRMVTSLVDSHAASRDRDALEKNLWGYYAPVAAVRGRFAGARAAAISIDVAPEDGGAPELSGRDESVHATFQRFEAEAEEERALMREDRRAERERYRQQEREARARRALPRILHGCRPTVRSIVERRVDGLGAKEIAEQDGIPRARVRKALSRFIDRLSPEDRELLAPLEISVPNPRKGRRS